MAPHVRPADPLDAAPIADVLADAGITVVAAEPDGLTRQRVRNAIRDAEGDSFDVWVAEDDAGVMGFVAVHWTYNLRHGVDGLVSDLFVHSERRGRGAGSALVGRARRAAAERGCMRLVLYSGRNGEAYARAFYPKLGFEEHPELACFILPVPPEAPPD